MPDVPAAATALLLCDLQNDFLHPDGAYARGGLADAGMAALPGRLRPFARALADKGGTLISTHFTLVPGRDGAPIMDTHLRELRPFLRPGDFAPGSWGQALVDDLQPAHFTVEKIAYSAFHMSRLEWVLRKAGIRRVIVAGIVTNGGVSSTIRDAHVREFMPSVLSDGCAAFSQGLHDTAIAALRPVARVLTLAEALEELA